MWYLLIVLILADRRCLVRARERLRFRFDVRWVSVWRWYWYHVGVMDRALFVQHRFEVDFGVSFSRGRDEGFNKVVDLGVDVGVGNDLRSDSVGKTFCTE